MTSNDRPTNRPTVSPAVYAGPFGKITAEIDPHTEGDRVGVLVTLLSAFSAVIGHDVKVAHGKTQPLGFWPVLVGPTGKGRKGTAHGAASQILNVAYAHFMDTQQVEGCPRTGEGFTSTLEALAVGDVASPVFLVEEEGDNLIDAAKRSKTLGVAFRKAWDGSTLTNITKAGQIVVKRPHLGMVMHVQPKNWGAISGTKDATGGTYNRFFPVYVERSKTVRLSKARTPSDVVVRLARQLRDMTAYAMNVSEVTMPARVEDVFETKHRPVVEALTLGTEALAQYAERALAYMLRLSALYALASKRDEITTTDLDAATALVTYMVDTVTHVLPDAQSTGGDLPVRIENYIREAGDTGRTSTEILKKYGVKRDALDMIVSANPLLSVGPGPYTGGRRADVFKYVPEVADEAPKEEAMGFAPMIEVPKEEAPEAPVSREALEAAMYGDRIDPQDKPHTVSEILASLPPKPTGVAGLRALLDSTKPEPEAVPEPASETISAPVPARNGVEALRAMLDAQTSAPPLLPASPSVHVQEALSVEDDTDDDDLSDLLAVCTFAHIAA
ncbi:DUF3987 domain-containing protein [Actinomadura roseirufa]|uniref:DUF3987 domain-containing protein n=1 Tax=Actinomadura roseirufa TaxID=2094049 RepID=UPI0013F16886|nr:DUF3987 domain-containing protein [Actinomadura roseirufa]